MENAPPGALSVEDYSDELEDELEKYFDTLIEAAHVRGWGHSPTGSQRAAMLGVN